MLYPVCIFSILLAGLAGCIGGVASEDGSSNGASLRGSLADDARVKDKGGIVSISDYPFLAFVAWYWTRTHMQSKIRPRNLPVTREMLYQCTGVFLTSKFVLTTASCFKRRIIELVKVEGEALEWKPNEAWVRVGADDGWRGGRPQAQTSDILKVIVHETYTQQRNTHDVDVALLEMANDFFYEDNVKRPQFSMGMDNLDLARCHEVGFGKIYPENRSPDRPLHSHPVVLGGKDYCTMKQVLFDQTTPTFDEFMMCGQPNTTIPKTECELDSGAAVLCSNRVTGLLSRRQHKTPCGGATDFSMYTLVPYSKVITFILFQVGQVPMTFPLEPSELLPRLEGNDTEQGEEGASSATVLGSRMVVVALVAFTAIRAL